MPDAARRYAPITPGFDDDRVTRVLLGAVFAMIAAFVVFAPPWLIDPRLVEGVNVWSKPQKFHVSLGVHFLTIAILAQLLPRPVRTGWALTTTAYLAVASLMAESAYIIVQSARGRRSHFNFDTPLEALLYAGMGVGAVLMVFVAVVLAIQIARKGVAGPGLKTGAVLGLSLGAVLTLLMAGYMSGSGSRWVGVHPEGGAVVPVFGWSRMVGDLRPAHFVALHMMQTLPAIGWLFDRVGGPGRSAVWVAAALQTALALGVFALALSGRPIWPA